MTTVLFFGGIVFLALFVWYLAATDQRTRLRAGLLLWISAILLFGASVYPPKENIRLGLDLKGGSSFTVELEGEPSAQALQEAVGVIRKRVDKFGVAEPLIQPSGINRIIVQIPGMETAQKAAARTQLEKVAKLDFRMVHERNEEELQKIAQGGAVPLGYELLDIIETREGKEFREKVLVRKRVELSGNLVSRAFRYVSPTGESGVSLEFKPEGKEQFGKITEANVGRRMAIVLDNEVRSAPVIRQAIYAGSAEISGSFTPQEAEELASVLENPLETPVKIIEERAVDPSLGNDSIKSSLVAAVVGSLGVVLFMLVYYRFLGVVSVLGLIVNLVILFGLLAQFHFTLTLPGIAGIILTVGMAVDAGVLIYERIREEMALGKPVEAAVSAGFDRAFSSILDANLTTIITAVILFYQGSGAVQGFAVTLTLGILGTLFSALIVTRNMIEWREVLPGGLKKLTMMQLVSNTKIDFIGIKTPCVAISVLMVLVSAVSLVVKGDRAYGVDFTGGEALTLTYSQKQDVPALRAALDQSGVKDYTLQPQKSPDGVSESVYIRTKFGEADKAESVLTEKFPQAGFQRKTLDKVGAVVGEELKSQSLIALTLSLLGILAYVSWRFEFAFAVGALLAVAHDVLITVGAFALFERELSLTVVGAVLAIAGYSINDTIVVFDRIREMLKRGDDKADLKTLMNHALNATLSRTVLTSGTTMISVFALYFLGGPVINDFAFALMVGIGVGTYSSIFVASPIVYWWVGGRDEWLRKQVQGAEQAADAIQA